MKYVYIGIFFISLIFKTNVSNIDIITYDVYGLLSNPIRDELILSNVDRKTAEEWINYACNENKFYKACIKVIRD